MPKQYTIEDMKRIAEERGGKCLSDLYVNAHTPLLWNCAEGHEWRARPCHIIRGSWCPECKIWIGEKICREIFTKLFNTPFKKAHPKWLKNPLTGRLMELDGYNQELNLAFEYNGLQHYILVEKSYFNKNTFKSQKERDKMKKDLCRRNGVNLVVIPYYIKHAEKLDFILKECNKLGYDTTNVPVDLFDYRSLSIYNKNRLDEINKEVKQWGAVCISESFIDHFSHLRFRCSKGHIWETSYSSIKHGHRCPVCSGKSSMTMNDIQRMAQRKGGVCLSHESKSNRQKLIWRCSKGHVWETPAYNIKSGTWCPVCAKGRAKEKLTEAKQQTLEDARKIAKQRGGICLSDIYVNQKEKMRWQCKKGHRWETSYSNIKSGTWCPVCFGSRKHTIMDMHDIASQHYGLCLSEKYVNLSTKLRWQCAEGHVWNAVPNSVLRGSWCPICARKARALKQKYSIEDYQLIAKEHGGECLSIKYMNAHTKLRWRCSNGHIWEAVPNSIRKGHWCPKCKGRKAWETRRIKKRS